MPTNNVPTQPAGDAAPPANTPPPPAPLATPPANSGFTKIALKLDDQETNDLVGQLQNENNAAAAAAEAGAAPGVASDIAQLQATNPNLNGAAVQQAVLSGDPATAAQLLAAAGVPANSTQGQDLINGAKTLQTVNTLAAKSNAGTLTESDLISAHNTVVGIIQNGAGTPQQKVNAAADFDVHVLGSFSNNSNLISSLKTGGVFPAAMLLAAMVQAASALPAAADSAAAAAGSPATIPPSSSSPECRRER